MIRKILFVALACAFAAPTFAADPAVRFDDGAISGLGARNIGSAQMSGRIAAFDAVNDASGKLTLYVGAASGGIWKSLDGGTTFKPVFDHEAVQSIGAVTIDPKNPKTIWVGTGEVWTRNSVSIGDGIYRSTDGGDTWAHLGLENSERISKILVDPRNSDTVYACAPGRLWSDSADRAAKNLPPVSRATALSVAGSGGTGIVRPVPKPKLPVTVPFGVPSATV